MRPKPRHLAREYASVFGDASVVGAYHHRPHYPAEAIELLARLAVDTPRAVLDVGCGTGDIARPLAPLVDRLDAIDISDGMIARGKVLPGGENPKINWIRGSVEETALGGTYASITAGESLHWMAWERVFPRFAEMLTAGGSLAIVERDWDGPPPLDERMLPLIQQYSTNRDYQPYDLITELEERGLFQTRGRHRCQPVPWHPTIDEYIECRHSQNGLSRDRMGEAAGTFDAALRGTLVDLTHAGVIDQRGARLQLAATATIVWGTVDL